MRLSEEQILDIAELLECGMICFYHRPTGTIESLPDPDDFYFDLEGWQNTIDKIENDRDNYNTFKKMSATEGFQVI